MHQKIAFLLLFLTVWCSQGRAQKTTADSVSLNGSWSFKTDPSDRGEQDRWFDPARQEGSWDTMDVPGNWDLRNEYAQYKGKAWYKKRMLIPAEWRDKLVRILFEAVYHDSKVWVNNTLVGSNNSGFLPFEFELSRILNYGDTNTIVVCADNTFRRGAIWNWGGIRRPVFLVAGNMTRIVQQHISPSVNLSKGTAQVDIKVTVRNHGHAASDVQGEVLLSAENGFKRLLPFTLRVPPDSTGDILLHTTLGKADVHLWNCDDPFLYQSRVTIRSGGQVLHQDDDRFGLRKVEVDHKNYTFKLNGESIRPVGFNLVPDDRTTGNTLPLWRVKEDIDMIKSFGANMARLTHLPLHKEMFDYLDEKGILIYPEIPLWGFDPLADKNNPVAKEWLRRLITVNYNHPSIIGWGVGNEIGDYPGVVEYVSDAIGYVRALDSTRQAVMVSHTANKARDPIQYSDLGLVNKYGTGIGSLADKMHELHPDKVLFYAEYGYGQFSEELNADLDARGMLDSLRFKPYLIGGALWTFNDYRSSYTGTKEFSENRAWGIVDVFRQKKESIFFLSERVRTRAGVCRRKRFGRHSLHHDNAAHET